MAEQKLYINTLLMKVYGDDTNFILDLGNRYTFKRLVLNAIMVDNYFGNFYDDYSDFTFKYNIGAGDVTQAVTCDDYIELDQFIDWFNTNNGTVGAFQLEDNPLQDYKYRLRYRATNALYTWSPIGKGWDKLGFDLNTAMSRQQTAMRLHDFTQSPTILVSFDNLQNAHTSKYGRFSFQVENNSAFGGKIMKVFPTIATNQQLELPELTSINQLAMTLLNCDMKQIRTVNGNNNDIEVILNISVFNE